MKSGIADVSTKNSDSSYPSRLIAFESRDELDGLFKAMGQEKGYQDQKRPLSDLNDIYPFSGIEMYYICPLEVSRVRL